MIRKKIISLLITFVLFFTAFIPGLNYLKTISAQSNQNVELIVKSESQEPAEIEYDNGIRTKKYIDINDDNTIDITMEAWQEKEKEVEIDPYDIVFVFDQSKPSNNERENVLKQANSFLNKLETDLKPTKEPEQHSISIVGYGRIKNDGKEDGIPESERSTNYNTGFYTENKSFITSPNNGLTWKEVSDFNSNELPTLENISNTVLNQAWMTPQSARSIVNTNTIKKWNSGAARLDAGLSLTNYILDNRKNNGRKKMVVIFTNSVVTRVDGKNKVTRVNSLETAVTKFIDNYNAEVFNIGDYHAMSPGTDTEFAKDEYKRMKKILTAKNKEQSSSHSFSLKDPNGLNNLYNEIGSVVNQKSSIKIQDYVPIHFEIVPDTTQLYKEEVNFKINKETDNKSTEILVPVITEVINGTKIASENHITLDPIIEGVGQKLIMKTRIKVKDGFLGGNKVPTNIKGDSAVFSGGFSYAFSVPQVDIPIEKPTINAEEINVYLGKKLDSEELKKQSTKYDGLTWQAEYVDIDHDLLLKDKSGIVVGNQSLDFLSEDLKYEVSVSVNPWEDGTFDGQNNSSEASINIFKPVITHENGLVFYGESINQKDMFNACRKSVEWIHEDKTVDQVTDGDAPDLTYNYRLFEPNQIKDNHIDTKEDIYVDLDLKIQNEAINKYTTFINTKDDFDFSKGKFLIEVKTVELTITKTGGVEGEPYVFNIKKDEDEDKYTQALIIRSADDSDTITISELPVGTYTIEEDTDWSWRYQASDSENIVLGKPNGPNGVVKKTGQFTFTNDNDEKVKKWLNHFDPGFKNVFGENKKDNKKEDKNE